MTTRALEYSEIQAIFKHVDDCNAKRNETMLIVGIGMALRASESHDTEELLAEIQAEFGDNLLKKIESGEIVFYVSDGYLR